MWSEDGGVYQVKVISAPVGYEATLETDIKGLEDATGWGTTPIQAVEQLFGLLVDPFREIYPRIRGMIDSTNMVEKLTIDKIKAFF
jgi:hypothetical protein